MADPIREALKRLLAVIKPKYTDPDEIVAVVRAMAAARTARAAERPAPAPADHVPDAGNMVAADEEREEREELARWLEFEADNAQELGCATIYDHDRLRWVAGYLRQPAPAPVPVWQPIDTAPHDGTEILASDYDAIEILTWSWDAWETGSGWINRNAHELHEAIRPAWWQPLPDHPPIPQPPQAKTTHPTPTEPPTDG